VRKATKAKSPADPNAPILHTGLTLVEVDEPELLEELAADPRLGPLIITRLSDRAAVVAPGDADRFVKLLLKAGHTPKVIGGA
jgi:hypothetical protein